MPDLTPADIDPLLDLETKATPFPHIVNRYEHGGARVYIEKPRGGRDLIADFYDEADRECWIAARYFARPLAEQARRVPELEAEIARLRAGIKKYGSHDRYCAQNRWPKEGEPFAPCNCGFAALAQKEERS